MSDNTPCGFQQITCAELGAGAVVALDVPAGANTALIQAEGNTIRWRDDGEDPTPHVGFLLDRGRTLAYRGDLKAIKFVSPYGYGASLNVSFYTRSTE